MYKSRRNKLGKFIKQKWTVLNCIICNKKFSVIPSRKYNAKFCSQKCSQVYHTGKNHHQYGKTPKTSTKNKISKTLTGKYGGYKSFGWKGGKRIHTSGYILIYLPNHPHSNKKYYPKHRLMAEKILGRYITKKEMIHHINGIKTDNRPENLYLFSSNSEHISYHLYLKYKRTKPITKSNIFKKIYNQE